MTAQGLAFMAGLAILAGGQVRAGDGSGGVPGNGRVCIRNGSSRVLFLVAEAPDGSRAAGEVAPGGILCSPPGGIAEGGDTPGRGRGLVGAFAGAEAVEGCSRRARPGRTQVLVAYADFDRCLWSDP